MNYYYGTFDIGDLFYGFERGVTLIQLPPVFFARKKACQVA